MKFSQHEEFDVIGRANHVLFLSRHELYFFCKHFFHVVFDAYEIL